MKETKKCSLLFLLLPSIVLSVAYLSVSVDARRYEGRSRAHNHQKHRGRSKNNKKILDPNHFYSFAPAPAQYYGSYEPHLAIFDVLSFGAKGDGVSNDSKAFLAAWKAACKVPWATVEVPSEFKFLSGQSHSKALVCPTLFSRGGSGHEPDHAGYLGEEMVTAAICGDVFAYPSIDSILAVWVLAS